MKLIWKGKEYTTNIDMYTHLGYATDATEHIMGDHVYSNDWFEERILNNNTVSIACRSGSKIHEKIWNTYSIPLIKYYIRIIDIEEVYLIYYENQWIEIKGE